MSELTCDILMYIIAMSGINLLFGANWMEHQQLIIINDSLPNSISIYLPSYQ